jgi:hypothetical protein
MTQKLPHRHSSVRPFPLLQFLWMFGLCTLLLGPASALGGVQVYPLYLFVKPPTRSVSVSVSNPTEKRQEAWVEFRYGYPVAGDSGKFAMHYVDSPYVNEPAAVSWLRAFPQRFVLGPRESQVVRIMISPPLGAEAGEYWARIVLCSFDRELKPPATVPGGNVQMRLTYISEIDIPLHCRIGQVTTGLTVTRVSAVPSAGKLTLGIGVKRTGTASYWGTMSIGLRNHEGKFVKNEIRVVAIYKDIDYPYILDVGGVPTGSYTLEIGFTTHRPGLRSDVELKTDPVKYSQEVSIP